MQIKHLSRRLSTVVVALALAAGLAPALSGTAQAAPPPLQTTFASYMASHANTYASYNLGKNGCTTLTAWYVGTQTSFIYGHGDGKDVVKNLVTANKGKLVQSSTPTGPAVFSVAAGTKGWGSSGGSAGHTGVVMSISGNKATVLETSTAYASNANRSVVSTYTFPFAGVTFANMSGNTKSPSSPSTSAGGDIPIIGDWNGDGIDTVGVYRPSNATFYLRSSNTGAEITTSVHYGNVGDIPIVGDWNGDGIDTVGVYRPSNATFYLRSSNTGAEKTTSVYYGNAGDIPIVGDWDKDGIDTVGVYRPSNATFYLRSTNTGAEKSTSVYYGNAGDIPIVGDWDKDGIDTIGVYRPSNATFYLRSTNTGAEKSTSVYYGNSGDKPIIGDWNKDGIDTIGVYRPSSSYFYLRSTNTGAESSTSVHYGNAS